MWGFLGKEYFVVGFWWLSFFALIEQTQLSARPFVAALGWSWKTPLKMLRGQSNLLDRTEACEIEKRWGIAVKAQSGQWEKQMRGKRLDKFCTISLHHWQFKLSSLKSFCPFLYFRLNSKKHWQCLVFAVRLDLRIRCHADLYMTVLYFSTRPQSVSLLFYLYSRHLVFRPCTWMTVGAQDTERQGDSKRHEANKHEAHQKQTPGLIVEWKNVQRDKVW